jgi:hypothetical protein
VTVERREEVLDGDWLRGGGRRRGLRFGRHRDVARSGRRRLTRRARKNPRFMDLFCPASSTVHVDPTASKRSNAKRLGFVLAQHDASSGGALPLPPWERARSELRRLQLEKTVPESSSSAQRHPLRSGGSLRHKSLAGIHSDISSDAAHTKTKFSAGGKSEPAPFSSTDGAGAQLTPLPFPRRFRRRSSAREQPALVLSPFQPVDLQTRLQDIIHTSLILRQWFEYFTTPQCLGMIVEHDKHFLTQCYSG